MLMSLYKCKMYVSRVKTIWESLSFHLITWLPVFNVPQFIAKLVIPPNYRLHRKWQFNEGALYMYFTSLNILNDLLIFVECQVGNFSAIPWQELVTFLWDEDNVHFVPNQHASFDFYSASSLKQQSVSRHVAPSKHLILQS
jgi:hypothetical protein